MFRRLWVRLLVLDRHIIFSHIFVVRIVMMFVWKDENKWKEAAGMAHFLKKNETIKIYDQFFWRYYKSGDHRQSVEGLGDGNGWTRDVKLLLRTFLNWTLLGIFSLFFLFNTAYLVQLIEIKVNLWLDSNCKLWCWKWLLYNSATTTAQTFRTFNTFWKILRSMKSIEV